MRSLLVLFLLVLFPATSWATWASQGYSETAVLDGTEKLFFENAAGDANLWGTTARFPVYLQGFFFTEAESDARYMEKSNIGFGASNYIQLSATPGTPNGSKVLRDDGTWIALSGGGDALVASPLSQFATTTSAQLAGVVSDETGTGVVVLATSPALVEPALGTPTALVLTNATGLPAAQVISTATGSIAATNVDAAIAELEDEKQDDLGITSVSEVSTEVEAFMGADNGALLSTLGAQAALTNPLVLAGSYTPTGTWDWDTSATATWPTFNQSTTGQAGSGDTATAFFSTGTIEAARLPDLSSTYADVKADTNVVEWHFNSTAIGAAATEPDEGMVFRIPVGVTYGTAWIDCGREPSAATHTGADGAAILTDSTATWTIDGLIGDAIRNVTDGSGCTITDNTATTITCTLTGGTDNDWDEDDIAEIDEAVTHTSLAVDIAYSSTRYGYGAYTDESTAITTVGSSVDISGYGTLTAGQYISARVSTASTGNAEMCDLAITLINN